MVCPQCGNSEIKEEDNFCLAWEKNKDKLEEYFRKARQE